MKKFFGFFPDRSVKNSKISDRKNKILWAPKTLKKVYLWRFRGQIWKIKKYFGFFLISSWEKLKNFRSEILNWLLSFLSFFWKLWILLKNGKYQSIDHPRHTLEIFKITDWKKNEFYCKVENTFFQHFLCWFQGEACVLLRFWHSKSMQNT